MKYIAGMPRGSGIVFDYAVDSSCLSPREQLRLDALAGRVASAGEPLRLFFEPKRLALQLRQLGFRELEDLDAAEINARYFSDREDELRVTSNLSHLLYAER
jgi:O-methyltransferase involved in polyketide biosynthesis